MKRLHIILPDKLIKLLKANRQASGVSVSWQLRHFATDGMHARQALSTCGIAGIYGEFISPADAIEQMAMYIIKERDDEVLPMDVLEMKPNAD